MLWFFFRFTWGVINKSLYHFEHYKKVGFNGESNIFIHDLGELKSFANNEERENLIKKFTNLIKY